MARTLMIQRPAGPRGAPPEAPILRVAEVAPEGVLRPAPTAASLRGRSYLALLLLLPGGLLILAGISVASVGVGLCLPWLRSLSGALRSTRDVGAAAAVPLSGGSGQRIGTPVTGSREQPHGASPDSGPRVWAGQGGTC